MKLEADALTFRRAAEMLARADALSGDGRIDLSDIAQVDSAGVALLLELERRARRQGRRVELIEPPEQLRGLLTFFGLDPIFAPGGSP
ncbi:MAG: STAS domain-containing protein [Nevskiales bacterium]|nr:STAS domain-containing protein [Nevskiales bacterium]